MIHHLLSADFTRAPAALLLALGGAFCRASQAEEHRFTVRAAALYWPRDPLGEAFRPVN